MGRGTSIKASILGPPLAKNDVRPLKTPLQKVPVALIEERRKKGLCFYCEEKWHNGHKCKSPKVFIYYLFFFIFYGRVAIPRVGG